MVYNDWLLIVTCNQFCNTNSYTALLVYKCVAQIITTMFD